MKIGVVFPQTEISSDPIVVRDYAQAAEGMGYSHILAFDHVVGAEPTGRVEGWRGAYNHTSLFHEPLVLYAYLAGLTKSIEFVTGILILPQRQAVLVAKQAAAVDVLSGGRLRLGVAVGWNQYEYDALNENFNDRGRRIGEQIEVMRLLWTNEIVDFHGRWHNLDRVGIKPLPVQQPIPVWMGGSSEAVLKRTARTAEGWFPQFNPTLPESAAMMERFRGYVRDAGRSMSELGIEGRANLGANGTPDDWARNVSDWAALGCTHLSVNTMGAGLASPRDHIEAIRRYWEVVSPAAEQVVG